MKLEVRREYLRFFIIKSCGQLVDRFVYIVLTSWGTYKHLLIFSWLRGISGSFVHRQVQSYAHGFNQSFNLLFQRFEYLCAAPTTETIYINL